MVYWICYLIKNVTFIIIQHSVILRTAKLTNLQSVTSYCYRTQLFICYNIEQIYQFLLKTSLLQYALAIMVMWFYSKEPLSTS